MLTARDSAVYLLDLEYDELSARIEADGVKPVHAASLWRELHRGVPPQPDLDRFSPPLRRWLESSDRSVEIDTPRIVSDLASSDGQTRKFLLELRDGHRIETVIMGYPGRFTVCLSTQVGCAMGCVFCATGQMGFVRHLRPGEIVAQALLANRVLQRENRGALRNLVLMGMGEPLHNYDAVIKALRILSDHRGLCIGPARTTLCTVGVVPGIRRLAAEQQPCNLAVSLHAATDEERAALVPVNSRWPLGEILRACRDYSESTGRKVLFGWTLIAGRNDSPVHARQVAGLLAGMNAQLNLIPLNPTEGYPGEAPALAAAQRFSEWIQAYGIPCTIRQRRGIDVGAGCGQLRSEAGQKNETAGFPTEIRQ